MDHDLADPLVDAAYGDMLRRQRNDLAGHLDLPVVVGRDTHPVSDLPPVRIVRIVLRLGFRGGLCRYGEGFLIGGMRRFSTRAP